MLSYDKTPDGILAPVRFWKDGKAALKRLWLTHLGTGENGQVQYIGTMREEDDGEEQEEEEWEEELSTEVMVLRVHQAWCSKETWAMWAPTATRMTVARRWLRRQKLEGYVEPEGLFHPRVYGTEPTAVASISIRIDIAHREHFLLASGSEDGIVKPMREPASPEVIWLTTPQRPLTPNPSNMRRVLEKMYAVEGHRGLVLSEFGPGIRVAPENFEEKATEILDDGSDQGHQDCTRCILRAFGKPYDLSLIHISEPTRPY